MRTGSKWLPLLLLTVLAMAPAMAADDVRCMPDRQVRPGTALPVFGAAGTGGGFADGSANGDTYAWSFAAPASVTVTDDGDLTDGGAGVTDDSYIAETVTFNLMGGTTRAAVTGTLDVGGTSCMVEIDIVDAADPISDTPDEALLVDVNIAIEEGLRFLYLNQNANGSWPGANGAAAYVVTSTGLAVWAFNNSGHAPSKGDIYSPSAQRGLDYIFGVTTRIVNIAGHAGSNFNMHTEGAGEELGINPTGSNGTGDEVYSGGFAIGAIISTLTPGAVVGPGAATGLTYAQYVEEFTDWAAYGQRDNNCPNNGCGGWDYRSTQFGSTSDDLSANSWMYVALEGAETVFGSTQNPRIKDLIDTSLVNRQYSNGADANFGRFGYRGTTPVRGVIGYATSCAGLSGLALEELPANKSAGTPDYSAAAANLDTFAEKEAAVLAHLGRNWARNPIGAIWLQGNHGNHYAMWTCCRGLRIAGVDLLNNDGTYGGAVGDFSWEKNIAAGGDTVTGGYWPYLVNQQQSDGRWQTNISQYNNIFETATAVLCLQPTVFGEACRDDDGDGFGDPGDDACPGGPADDCDDDDAAVNPDAQEICDNQIDDDCDGDIDAADSDCAGDCIDADGDGYGDGPDCRGPDCDDTDEDVNPGEREDCDNGIDDDCDGLVDIDDVDDCDPLLVELESFKAEATRQGVKLSWRTSLEIDTVGFRVLRGKDDGRELALITPDLIPARGNEVSGADYGFVDASRQKRGTVFYWLEDIDLNGKVTRHGPVAVQLELPIVGRPDAARPRPSRRGNR